MNCIKNIIGLEADCKKEVTLKTPDPEKYNRLRNGRIYQNKDFFWNRIRPAVKYLSEYDAVRWDGKPELTKFAERATITLLQKQMMASKDSMMDFYFLFMGNEDNSLQMLSRMLTEKGLELAARIVNDGALCLAELPGLMGWPKYKSSYWDNYTDNATLNRWIESEDTMALAAFTRIAKGPYPKQATQSSYTSNYPFIVPTPLLIKFMMDKLADSAEMTDDPGKQDDSLTLFSGEDFLDMGNTIQNLIVSRVVTATKTRVGVSAIKKLHSYVSLRQFPESKENVMQRLDFVANLAFSVFGEPSALKLPSNPMLDEDFLKQVYGSLCLKSKYLLSEIIASGAKGVISEFYYLNGSRIGTLFTCICEVLKIASRTKDGAWAGVESFYRRVNYYLASCNMDYIFPCEYSERPESVRDTYGKPVSMAEFKSLFHDVIMRAMIEGLASIGAVDLYYDNGGHIKFLRLSEAGKWYVGMTNVFPNAKGTMEIDDALEVDDASGMIIVKNSNYPYITLLASFANKITDTRYLISEKTFVSGCDNPGDLDGKIKRFKTFILPEPGPNVKDFLKRLKRNCNLVKRTQGGSTYQLYDIDPNNTALHNLIMDDKEIRSNTLRVEGCRLLVKAKFADTFFQKLTRAGFLVDL